MNEKQPTTTQTGYWAYTCNSGFTANYKINRNWILNRCLMPNTQFAKRYASFNPIKVFWRSKPKSPITEEDEQWIALSYDWFGKAFAMNLSDQEIYLPNRDFLGFKFTGTEDDAIRIVEIVADNLGVKDNSSEVYFFEEFQPTEFTDEGIYSNYEEGSQLAGGLYSKVVDGVYQIGIERTLLTDPIKLIVTVAHELAHIKLLGEDRLEENDEYLTDLSASLFGFVIFLANDSINKVTTWAGNTHTGWRIGGGSGYLHYKVYPFLIAYWLTKRNEKKPDWLGLLDKEIQREVLRGITQQTGYWAYTCYLGLIALYLLNSNRKVRCS